MIYFMLLMHVAVSSLSFKLIWYYQLAILPFGQVQFNLMNHFSIAQISKVILQMSVRVETKMQNINLEWIPR